MKYGHPDTHAQTQDKLFLKETKHRIKFALMHSYTKLTILTNEIRQSAGISGEILGKKSPGSGSLSSTTHWTVFDYGFSKAHLHLQRP